MSSRFERLYLQFVPGEKPGKLVLKQMAVASQSLKSFESQNTVNVKVMKDGTEETDLSVQFSGPTTFEQLWNPQTYKQDFAFVGTLGLSDQTYMAKGNIRFIDGVSYVQATELPTLPDMDLRTFLDTWVKFSPTDLAAAGIQARGGIKQLGVEKPAVVNTEMTPEKQQQIQAAFFDLLGSADVSPAKVEQKDGNAVYALTLTLQKPAVTSYIVRVKEIMGQPATEQEQGKIKEMVARVDKFQPTVWVDKSTFYPRHIELPLLIDLPEKETAEGSTKSAALSKMNALQDADELNVFLSSDLQKHNQTFSIAAPDNAQDSQIFFTKIMGVFMPKGLGLPSRLPTMGTTELPQLTPEQRYQLEQYEKMMGSGLPKSFNY